MYSPLVKLALAVASLVVAFATSERSQPEFIQSLRAFRRAGARENGNSECEMGHGKWAMGNVKCEIEKEKWELGNKIGISMKIQRRVHQKSAKDLPKTASKSETQR